MKTYCGVVLGLLLLAGCDSKPAAESVSDETTYEQPLIPQGLTREAYHDKVLGLLVGSALGDAMGAPTEMWSRADIRSEYGEVTDLDSMVRSPSGEGTWRYNLPAGGTTDDTRWKQLTAEFVLNQTQKWGQLDPVEFAEFLVEHYQAGLDSLKATDGFDPEPYERATRRVNWLQEWALVARPYAAHDLDGYVNALSRFYGGEPTCAGMLYAPLLGACTPGQPYRTYEQVYRLALFDQGYARDLTALVAAMTSAGFRPGATPETLLAPVRDVDPQGYYRSRLVGRSAYRLLRQARALVAEAPPGGTDTLERARRQRVYERLDQFNQDLPFHPGEIYLIALTAMLYADFDYPRTMQFIVNYGRDNDTVAAVAGAILGAYHGASRLPKTEVERVIRVNREQLGIDLPKLADQFTEQLYGPPPKP
jgi:hypothetical protein